MGHVAVVVVSEVVAGLIGVADFCETIALVVAVAGGLLLGVFDGFEESVVVIGVSCFLQQWPDLFGFTSGQVVFKAGDILLGVGEGVQMAVAVVVHVGDGGDDTIEEIARYNPEAIFAWTFQQHPSFLFIDRL